MQRSLQEIMIFWKFYMRIKFIIFYFLNVKKMKPTFMYKKKVLKWKHAVSFSYKEMEDISKINVWDLKVFTSMCRFIFAWIKKYLCTKMLIKIKISFKLKYIYIYACSFKAFSIAKYHIRNYFNVKRYLVKIKVALL